MSDDMSREATSLSLRSGEQTFEINIKLIHNQVHKVHVTKDMPVAVLKGKLIDITGASVDQQCLFYGGRVLNDDQTLSEYYVEEGHTLHLVTRRYGQSAPGSTSANGNRNTGNDSSVNRQRTRPGKGPHNVIFGVNMTETGTGEEMTDQIGVGDVLRSLSSGLMAPGGGAGNNQPSANGTCEAIGLTPPPRSPPPAEPPPPHVPTSPPGPLLSPPQALHGLKRRRENLSPSTFLQSQSNSWSRQSQSHSWF
ncbi:ubiquitin domain-containing protein DSK2b-like isoform X3 [Carex rostrata]